MEFNRLDRFFAVTVSTPTLEDVCVRKSGHMQYAPEDSHTCLKYEKRLVQHHSALGGIFKWDTEVQAKSKTPPADELRGSGRLR